MNRTTPWDEINIPNADYNVRRVPDSGDASLFWGRDISGRCLFVVELHGEHTALFRKERTWVRGIEVDLRGMDSAGIQGLILALEKHEDRDLFFGLCKTLIASLAQTTDSAMMLSLALSHIKRWKAFLASQKRNLLTNEEIRGLFGELMFLRCLYRKYLDKQAALEAWKGPDGAHQDFIFGNTAVEVKALSGQERNTVRISSEDQLESLCDRLFLLIYRFAEAPVANNSLSLNEMVRSVEGELAKGADIEEFYKRLASCGYVEMQEYDSPKFRMASQHAYRVVDDFPRLARSGLPDGVIGLRYDLKIEKIRKFECDLSEVGEE